MEGTTENKMGTTPVMKLIVSMSLPAMLSMLVQALYNIVDSMFVSWYSQSALTAVSLAFPIQMLMISVGVGTGVGINSLVSRRLGEHRQEEADHAATHGLILGALSWMLFLIFGLFFSEPFIAAFSDDPAIIAMGDQYLSIVCVFSFGTLIEIAAEKILQATGNMIFPMAAQLIGAITNIILDPIFIFGWLGIPSMGVAGAAIATVIGQILSMIFLLGILLFRKHAVKIRFKRFRFRAKTIKDIYAVGFPSIIMQSIGSVLVMGLNAILGAVSQTGVAILGVYYKLQSFVFMPVFGLTQGMMPIMGYNYGARNKKRLVSTLKLGAIIALVIMAVGTLLFWGLAEQLLGIFKADAQMITDGIPALHIISLSFVPAALGITFSTIFQAVGMGFKSLLISLLRQLILILPAAYFLSKMGLLYVWYAFPIAEIISCVVSILIYLHLYKTHIQHLEEPVAP